MNTCQLPHENEHIQNVRNDETKTNHIENDVKNT